MRLKFRLLFPLFVFAAAITGPLRGAERPLRIVIVGDSTVSNYPAEVPERGWGQYLGEYFKPGTATVINLAKPGRSTKTFIAEGRWQQALGEKPDYVLIQFGHNDSHAPTKPEATDATTDYSVNLRRYVDDARAIGARPVLVTPMVRRSFDRQGRLVEASPPNRQLVTYAIAMAAVAREKHVPLVDLQTSSRALVEKLGPIASKELANKPGDSTHFNEKGARAMATLVMQELPSVVPELKSYVKRPENRRDSGD